MTLDEIKDIFKYQTTADADYIPKDVLEYWTFSGRDKLLAKIASADIDKLTAVLEGYQFEGYRDRTPLFLKPEADL
jgi:hypothetical protein